MFSFIFLNFTGFEAWDGKKKFSTTNLSFYKTVARPQLYQMYNQLSNSGVLRAYSPAY